MKIPFLKVWIVTQDPAVEKTKINTLNHLVISRDATISRLRIVNGMVRQTLSLRDAEIEKLSTDRYSLAVKFSQLRTAVPDLVWKISTGSTKAIRDEAEIQVRNLLKEEGE